MGVGNKASYYEILRVSPKASDEDIRRAYRFLAKKFHPDHNPNNRQIAELRLRLINEAYAALKTREKRLDYDRKLNLHAHNDNKDSQNFLAQLGKIFWPQHPKTPAKNSSRNS